MKKGILLSLVFVYSFVVFAQQAPPGFEIYLLDLSSKKANVSVKNPLNITNRVGYDNQPSFHPYKPLLYFSSTNADGKTDIMEFNLKTNIKRNFTTTSDREYSPTVTPDKQFISCIIQRDNGAQDLGKYPLGGGDPTVLINTLTVGYHAWMNDNTLLLFVLGDTLTLHQYDLSSKSDKIIARQIGRSLHKIPNSNAVSFVHKVSEKEWLIKKLSPIGQIETITATLPGRDDMAWTPDGKIIMSDGKKLFYYWPGKSEAWQEIKQPVMPAGTITRLAVNPKGNALAIVVSE